jgi:hypothetical protein
MGIQPVLFGRVAADSSVGVGQAVSLGPHVIDPTLAHRGQNMVRQIPLQHDRRDRGPSATARFAMRLLALSAIVLFGGCEPPEGPTTPAAQELFVSASPSEQRVAQGATTVYSVRITRVSISGPVTLSAPSATLPSGVSVTFDPATLGPGETESVAAVSISANAPVQYGGEPPLTEIPIRATGPEGLVANTTLKARLVPSSLAGITLNITPASIEMQIDETREALITVARQGNYSGPVTLAFVSEQVITAGVRATLTPVVDVPDTWRISYVVDDPIKIAVFWNLAGIAELSFPVIATAPGVSSVTLPVRVSVVRPLFRPQVVSGEVTLEAGKQATVPVAVGRSRVQGPIVFTVPRPEPGITLTFAPSTVLDDATQLTVRVDASVEPKRYVIDVLGTPTAESGAAPTTWQVFVVVTPPTPVPAYSLDVPNLTVPQGGTGSSTINVTRSGGFTGPVGVSFAQASGAALPAGMSVTVSPPQVTGNSATLQVATTSATPVGPYILRATGSATVPTQASAPFAVTVTTPANPVAGMVLDPADISVPAGVTVQYRARLVDAAGNETSAASGFEVVYSVQTSEIAELTSGDNKSGRITTKVGGTTGIIARYQPIGGGASTIPAASGFLRVGNATAGAVAAVRITNDHLLASVGVSFGFTAIALDVSGNEVPGVTFRWSSNSASVLMNSSTGVASAISTGGSLIFAVAVLPNGRDGPAGVSAMTVRSAGAVQGTINVPSGIAVGATIRAYTGAITGAPVGYGVVTAAGASPGRAYIPGLIAGTYTITVSLPGYATQTFTNVVVTSQTIIALNGGSPIVLVPSS